MPRLTNARIYVGAKRVLVVDLDLETAGDLRDAFGREGCELRHASSCSEAIALAESWDPCLILLDVSVSELAGLGFVDRFRAHSSAAIIVLSAREGESKTAPGFDHGADDFLHKPFKLDELLACARSALRIRSAKQPSARAHALGSLTIDEGIGAVEWRGQPVHCSPKELLTLQCLANANGRVLSNHELINRVWGPGSPQRAYHLRVFIGRLRAKIEERSPNSETPSDRARLGAPFGAGLTCQRGAVGAGSSPEAELAFSHPLACRFDVSSSARRHPPIPKVSTSAKMPARSISPSFRATAYITAF